MADTLPDITVSPTGWSDVYTLTGIPVGSTITICNKGSSPLLFVEAVSAPAANSTDGKLIGTLYNGSYNITVTGSPTGVWLKSFGLTSSDVNVQLV